MILFGLVICLIQMIVRLDNASKRDVVQGFGMACKTKQKKGASRLTLFLYCYCISS